MGWYEMLLWRNKMTVKLCRAAILWKGTKFREILRAGNRRDILIIIYQKRGIKREKEEENSCLMC